MYLVFVLWILAMPLVLVWSLFAASYMWLCNVCWDLLNFKLCFGMLVPSLIILLVLFTAYVTGIQTSNCILFLCKLSTKLLCCWMILVSLLVALHGYVCYHPFWPIIFYVCQDLTWHWLCRLCDSFSIRKTLPRFVSTTYLHQSCVCFHNRSCRPWLFRTLARRTFPHHACLLARLVVPSATL
jgi:hypothetical protein